MCQVEAGKGMYGQATDFTSQNDFAQMRRLGFNIVRLCLNWNLLEPKPGSYSRMYLERIAQVVEWAKEQGIYIILDMHQDQYSRFIFGNKEIEFPPYLQAQDGQDGAPSWAVVTDGLPALAIYGIGPLNLASMAAFDNFYSNRVLHSLPQGEAPGPGLQDHFIGAIAFLARRFKNESAVIGYEIMNEPAPGFHGDLLDFSRSLLYPFYARVIQAITGVRDGLPTCPESQPNSPGCAYPSLGIQDTKHLFFFEPMAVRNQFDFSFQESVPFTTYPRIVYAPHVYTHIFTIDSVLGFPPNNTIYPPSFDFAYTTARAEANAMKAALFITEFGGPATLDNVTLHGIIEAQERSLSGGTLWSWKSNTGDDVSGNTDTWTIYAGPVLINGTMQQNGPLIPSREQYLSRVYPRTVFGELMDFKYNVVDQSFVMHAFAASAPGTTVIYIPPIVRGNVSVSETAQVISITTNPDGSRLAYIKLAAPGVYQVAVLPWGALPPPLQSLVRPSALHPKELLGESMSYAKQMINEYTELVRLLSQLKEKPEVLSSVQAFLASSDRFSSLRDKLLKKPS